MIDRSTSLACTVVGLALVVGTTTACVGGSRDTASGASPSDATRAWTSTTAKHGGSGITVRYRTLGTPSLNAALGIEVELAGAQSADAQVRYEAADGLRLDGPAAVAALAPGAPVVQTLTVTPLRGGISYLNVITRQNGQASVISVPVQVGAAQKPAVIGIEKTTPQGERVISLPAQ